MYKIISFSVILDYKEFASLFPKIRQFDAARGMKTYVTKFKEPPTSQPLTVCLHTAATDDDINHSLIREMIYDKYKKSDKFKIEAIQFLARNVILGGREAENRWLITLNTREAAVEIVQQGVFIFGKRLQLSFFDDVQQQEYKDYQDYKRFEVDRKRLFEQILGKQVRPPVPIIKKKEKKEKKQKKKSKKRK